jgi:predicted PilT family ATPase
MIKDFIEKIPAGFRWPLAGFLVIVIVLGGWLYGARLTNAISRKIFRGKNAVITADVQKNLNDANGYKEVASKALQELADKKKELAQAETELANAKQKLQIAESVLADKSKTADAKLKAFNDALKQAPTVHVEPESLSEQCARAKSLDLDLEICKQ